MPHGNNALPRLRPQHVPPLPYDSASGIDIARRSVRPRNVPARGPASRTRSTGEVLPAKISKQRSLLMSICKKLLPIRCFGAGFHFRAGRSRSGCTDNRRPRLRASPRRAPSPRCSGGGASRLWLRRGWGAGPWLGLGAGVVIGSHHRQRGLSAAARLLLRRLCLRRPLLLPLRLLAATRARSARRISARSSGIRASIRPTGARSGSAPT